MSQIYALASALLYGLADFSGGRAAREVSAWQVAAWSQLVGVPVLLLGLLLVPASDVRLEDLAFGGAAGVMGIVGIPLLYAALARGTMSVVAPIVGAVSAAIPVGFDVATGGSIGAVAWVGILVALVAVVAIVSSPDETATAMTRQVVWLAAAAGLAFALFFVLIAQTDPASGLWPIVMAKSIAIPAIFVVALAAGAAAPPPRSVRGYVATAGSFDMAANVTVLLALQTGPLGVNVVLSSLYPAVTALAGLIVLRERPTRTQSVGIILALIAVGLLAV